MKTEADPPRKTSGQTPELNRLLLDRARDGDEQAFAELVRHYEQMVYSFSFKVCRDRDYAEQTTQDTFVNVFRKLKQFDGKSKFSTWLYSIVTNNCMVKRRKKKLEKASVSVDELNDLSDSRRSSVSLPFTQHTPFEETVKKEVRTALDAAIQKLPLDYRLVFILRDLEGQSAGNTAKIMKLSVPAVKSRLRRARMFLREQLNEHMIAE